MNRDRLMYLAGLLPEETHWHDVLTPQLLDAILAKRDARIEALEKDAARYRKILPHLEAHNEFSDEESQARCVAWIQFKNEAMEVPFPWHGDDGSVSGRIDAAITQEQAK